MPINKNAFIRYQTLDRCFRNPGRDYSIDDLLEECNKALAEDNPSGGGVKKRQLYKDIAFMESERGWLVPLERFKIGYKTYYRYSDLKFSINNQPLNTIEAEEIRSALLVLSKFKGMPQFNWVNELLPKLEQSFSLSEYPQEIISFDNNQYLKGIEFLDDLFKAILNQEVLKITYKKFGSQYPRKFHFHPYYLKQSNNRWFLLGKTAGFKDISIMALDRIVNIEVDKSQTYIPNTEVNFEEYFEDVVGVTVLKGIKPQKILIKMSAEYAPYVLTKPLHGSQKKVEETEGHVIISIEVIPTWELINRILALGSEVEVLSPPSFRNTMVTVIRKMLSHYRKKR